MINYSEDQEKLYHLQVGRGDVGRYVLLAGRSQALCADRGVF